MRGRRLVGFGLAFGLAAASVAVGGSIAPASAAGGGLDPTFGTGGSAALPTLASADAVARQADGKLVVAGTSAASSSALAITRRAADGTLDEGFGDGGTATASIAAWTTDVGVADVAVDDAGRIFVLLGAEATHSDYPDHNLFVIRFTATGEIDRAFGYAGFVQADLGGSELPQALVVQPDGKLLVAGSSDTDPGSHGYVIRFLANGRVDDSFGDAGTVTVYEPVGDMFSWNDLKALVLQDDGRIVVAGGLSGVDDDGTNTVTAYVARLTDGGAFDASFDGDGQALLEGAAGGFLTDVTLAPDGDVVAAGRNGSDVIVMRLDGSGTPDPSFSGDGRQAIPEATALFADQHVVVDGDGRILVSGTTADEAVSVARLTANGSVDETFAPGGTVHGPAGRSGGATLDADGRLLVVAADGGAAALLRFRNGGTDVAAGQPDLVVVDVRWTPGFPVAGEAVRFSAIIENRGTAATPEGVIHGVGFFVDGRKFTFSDTHTASIAPGASVRVSANGGGTSGLWKATAGTHAIRGFVDDVDRITNEADEGNNIRTESMSVPSPTPARATTGSS